MNSLTETQLGDRGLEYVKTELAKGDDLANFILTEIPIDKGSVTVHLPSGGGANPSEMDRGFLSV